MVWRVPTREIGAVPYEEGLELPPEYITGQPGDIRRHVKNIIHVASSLNIRSSNRF